MTDRHAGYLITLERDIRDDDAEATIAAFQQIKGVLSVQPVVADVHTGIAESRARHEIVMKVYEACRMMVEGERTHA